MEEPTQAPSQSSLNHEDKTVYIKKSVLVALGIMLLIALGLTLYTGYRIFSSKNNLPTTTPDLISSKIKKVEQETPKVRLIREIPTGAPGKDNEQQIALLTSNQRGTSSVFIGKNCSTSPTVAQIITPDSFYLQNDDATSHTLQFIDNTQWKYSVEGNKFQKVTSQQFTKGKFYQYTCDGKKESAGYIIIP
ncbi:MAG: hypothetical protein AAB478_04235 [Patescibacteria group bacterium]